MHARTHAHSGSSRASSSERAHTREKSLIREESSLGNRKQQTLQPGPRSLVKIVGEERPIKETSKALTPVSVRGLRAYQRAMADRYGCTGERLCMTNANIDNARSNRRRPPIASIAASPFVPLGTHTHAPSRPMVTPRPLTLSLSIASKRVKRAR